jgi:hypothetical protein
VLAAPIRACTVRLDLEPAVRRRAGGRVEVWRIDDAHANPKLAWEGLGAPQWPSAAQIEATFAPASWRQLPSSSPP